MSSSTSSSEPRLRAALRVGLARLGEVLTWVLARTWLALVFTAAGLGAMSALGRAYPVPPGGSDHTIVDAQMRRSRTIGEVDLLVLGDSSGLTAIDPVRLSEHLGGASVEMLSVIGPVRAPGYARLLRNYLERGLTARAVLFVLQPLSLMHAFDPDAEGEMHVVLAGRWESAGVLEDARRAINFHVLRGVLDEPFPGSFGALYGNGLGLRGFIEASHGSMVHPLAAGAGAPGAAAARRDRERPRGALDYRLVEDGRASLAHMRQVLDGAPASRILVAFAPLPASLGGEKEAGARARMLAEVVALLGLPPDSAIELPPSLPDEQMVDFTHASGSGRAAYTDAIAPAVARVLGESPQGGLVEAKPAPGPRL